jgi:hypothetical protein
VPQLLNSAALVSSWLQQYSTKCWTNEDALKTSEQALVEKGYLEHQAIGAKLSAHMGLGNQVGAQGPCGHQVLQL